MTTLITTMEGLNNYIEKTVIPNVIRALAKSIQTIMQNFIIANGVSVTIAEIIDVQYANDGRTCSIYADTQGEPSSTGEESRSGGFTKFVSLDGSPTYDGKTIAWWVADWLEDGVEHRKNGRYIGNQPITPNSWFSNTLEYLEKNLDNMVKKALRKEGLKVR